MRAQKKIGRGGPVLWTTLLQLGLSFFLVSLISYLLGGSVSWGASNPIFWLFALFNVLLGLLFTFSIAYNLHILEIVMGRLAQNLPAPELSLRWRGSVRRLFWLVNEIGQPLDRQSQIQRQTVEYRDQLLVQVGKNAAQEERNRLARDLHDSIKQQIFSIAISAAAVKARWENNLKSAYKIVEDIERTALEAQVEMQALLQQLRPVALENIGLTESLKVQCQALGYRTGAEVSSELEHLPDDESLPIGAQEMIFRIVQEAFANIARHARATHVWLSMYQQGEMLLVEIGDDGQGFDIERRPENKLGGMGLANVRERVQELGGSVSIWSQVDRGTTVHVAIPLVKKRIVDEQEEIENGITRAARGIGRILSWANGILEVGGAIILVSVPYGLTQFVVALCIVTAILLGGAAYFDRMQIILNGGSRSPQYLLLKARGLNVLRLSAVLCILYACYIYQWPIALLIISIPISALSILHHRQMDHYYRALKKMVLRSVIEQKIQRIIIDFVAWALVCGGVLIFWMNVYYPQSYSYWYLDRRGLIATVVIAMCWFSDILLRCVQAFRWQRTLTRMENSDE